MASRTLAAGGQRTCPAGRADLPDSKRYEDMHEVRREASAPSDRHSETLSPRQRAKKATPSNA